jgi:O-antigen chain-terminating methyltransferase
MKRVVRRLVAWLIEGALNQINAVLNSFQGYFESHERRLHDSQQRFTEEQKELAERLHREQEELSMRLAEEYARLSERLDEGHRRLSELFEYLHERVESFSQQRLQEIAELESRVSALEELKIPQRLGRTERLLRYKARSTPSTLTGSDGHRDSEAEASTPATRLDTFFFHERFRGEEEVIARRQARYLELFRHEQKVLDVGCGRGEFLSLLSAKGVPCYGIDADPDMVRLCEEKGLEVYHGDALAHLKHVESASLGGIFSAQVLEHFEIDALMQFIGLAFDRLAPGGILVAETLNPESLAFLEYFYLDLSHVRPLHSETLGFLLESAGFVDVQTEFLSPVHEDSKLMEIPLEQGVPRLMKRVLEVENHNIEVLNRRLFGPVEYAIIAWKPPDEK